jgi:hypothetical protein
LRSNTAFSYVKGSLAAPEVDADASRLADPISRAPDSSSSSKLIDALDAARVARASVRVHAPCERAHSLARTALALAAHRDADRIEFVDDARVGAALARAQGARGVDVAVARASDDIRRVRRAKDCGYRRLIGDVSQSARV